MFVLPNILAPKDYPRFLRYLIESRGIDTVVITASTLGYQLLPWLRAVAPHVAFIDMCHVEEAHWNNGGHPRFAVGYQQQLDLNLVTTGHLADWMCERGAERARIEVLYTGIRTEKPGVLARDRASVRAELGIAAHVPVIVFAGRLCAQKRPALLAQILGAAKRQGLTFEAIIVGDGELRGEFEGLLKSMHLKTQVHMLGAQAHDRWLEVLGASDILLMPSQYEGISIALLEAIAAGVVPVVARVGGQAEIVDAEAGVLVPHSDSELQHYVDALQRLTAAPEPRQQMAQRCRELAQSRLSWENMVTHFLRAVDKAHALRLQQPRLGLPEGLARESASTALELRRVSEAVDWMWRNGGGAHSQPHAGEVQAITRVVTALVQMRAVRAVLRNRIAKRLAKWMLLRFT